MPNVDHVTGDYKGEYAYRGECPVGLDERDWHLAWKAYKDRLKAKKTGNTREIQQLDMAGVSREYVLERLKAVPRN